MFPFVSNNDANNNNTIIIIVVVAIAIFIVMIIIIIIIIKCATTLVISLQLKEPLSTVSTYCRRLSAVDSNTSPHQFAVSVLVFLHFFAVWVKQEKTFYRVSVVNPYNVTSRS